jgi:DNA-binding transcriptional ArsR family regulator
MSYEAALDALGDPTRRRILERLKPGPASVGDVAADLPVSRPAVSKHLKILGDAGLVTYVRVGTRSLYRIDAQGLEAVRAYLDTLWDDVLTAFVAEIEHRQEQP